MRAFNLPSYILFCCVWMLSLGGLFIFSGKWRGSESGGDGRWRKTGRVEVGKLWSRYIV